MCMGKSTFHQNVHFLQIWIKLLRDNSPASKDGAMSLSTLTVMYGHLLLWTCGHKQDYRASGVLC